MIYLSCQPAIPRYTWEVEVYLHNFMEMGVNPQSIHVVLGYVNGITEMPEDWLKLQKGFENVNFYFYPDTRGSDNTYQPSLQAHILEKHWKQNPWLEKENIFFHDADFLLTKPFDFSPYLSDDFWYFSDTISYIGSDYIRSKGESVLDKMCEVAEIDKQMVVERNEHSGGAQKLIKNVPTHYWSKVYWTSMRLWKEIPPLSASIKKYKESKGEHYHELQHWTMSMWAELWEGWKLGFETRIPKEFDFMFATNPIEDWDRLAFFHNAGILGSQRETHFFKGDFDRLLPYNLDLPNITDKLATKKYYEWVKKVGKKSVLLS